MCNLSCHLAAVKSYCVVLHCIVLEQREWEGGGGGPVHFSFETQSRFPFVKTPTIKKARLGKERKKKIEKVSLCLVSGSHETKSVRAWHDMCGILGGGGGGGGGHKACLLRITV